MNYNEDKSVPITFILIVRKEMKSIEYFLKIIKDQFLQFFKEILVNYNALRGYSQDLFSTFDIIIKNNLK